MARKLGVAFRTKSGRWGSYVYVNGKRVGFVSVKENYHPRRTGQMILNRGKY